MPTGWYKPLLWFVSNPLYKLEITENYGDLPQLCKEDVYSTQYLMDNGFKNINLEALKFVRKFIQTVSLADIATVDGKRTSQ